MKRPAPIRPGQQQLLQSGRLLTAPLRRQIINRFRAARQANPEMPVDEFVYSQTLQLRVSAETVRRVLRQEFGGR